MAPEAYQITSMERIRSEIAVLTHVHSPSHIDTNVLPSHAVKTGDRKFTRHEQVCLMRPRFERYFSDHQARRWEKFLSKRSPIKHTCS